MHTTCHLDPVLSRNHQRSTRLASPTERTCSVASLWCAKESSQPPKTERECQPPRIPLRSRIVRCLRVDEPRSRTPLWHNGRIANNEFHEPKLACRRSVTRRICGCSSIRICCSTTRFVRSRVGSRRYVERRVRYRAPQGGGVQWWSRQRPEAHLTVSFYST